MFAHVLSGYNIDIYYIYKYYFVCPNKNLLLVLHYRKEVLYSESIDSNPLKVDVMSSELPSHWWIFFI